MNPGRRHLEFRIACIGVAAPFLLMLHLSSTVSTAAETAPVPSLKYPSSSAACRASAFSLGHCHRQKEDVVRQLEVTTSRGSHARLRDQTSADLRIQISCAYPSSLTSLPARSSHDLMVIPLILDHCPGIDRSRPRPRIWRIRLKMAASGLTVAGARRGGEGGVGRRRIIRHHRGWALLGGN